MKWCMVPEMWSVIEFLSFSVIFYSFTSLTTWKIKILKKQKNTLGLQYFTQLYHMVYGSWDMKHDRQKFLSFWVNFCLFTFPTPQHPRKWSIILQKCTKNHDHLLLLPPPPTLTAPKSGVIIILHIGTKDYDHMT